MELIPEENNKSDIHNLSFNDSIIDESDEIKNEKIQKIQKRVYDFETSLIRECNSYGWSRGIRKACDLYRENLELSIKLDKLLNDNENYKRENIKLQELINKKTPIRRYDALDDISTPDIIPETL
jgi:hypothetical protein